MTTPQPFGITDEARSLLGVEGPSETRAPVTWEQIQRYCYAVDDLNPLYLDEAAAARGPHGGIIAPPLFTGVGSFKPVSLSQLRADGLPSSEGDPLRPPIPGARSRLLGSDITFLRPVRVGDALTRRSHLAELVEKQGRSGPMVFSVRETQITNQRGETVCVERTTTAAIRQGPSDDPRSSLDDPRLSPDDPHSSPGNPRLSPGDPRSSPGDPHSSLELTLTPDTRAQSVGPPPTPAKALSWSDVEEGQGIPGMTRLISAVQVFLYGAVKGNSHLIHYDRDHAQREGLPERVAQGDLLGDFLCQLAVRWMGSTGVLRRFSYEARGPGFIGEEIIHYGRVLRRWTENEDATTGLVELELWSEGSGGRLCLRGSATIELPLGR